MKGCRRCPRRVSAAAHFRGYPAPASAACEAETAVRPVGQGTQHRTFVAPEAVDGALSRRAARLLAGLPCDEDNLWVIAGRKWGSHLTDLQHPWQRIRERTELPAVRIHDLRHRFASGGLLGHVPLRRGHILQQRSSFCIPGDGRYRGRDRGNEGVCRGDQPSQPRAPRVRRTGPAGVGGKREAGRVLRESRASNRMCE